MMANTPHTSTATAPPRSVTVLIVVALLAVLLGIYQWVELVQLRTGGAAPLCSFSATLNCAGVWNSPLSDTVHRATGLPIVGWGMAWSAIVLILGVWLWRQGKAAAPADDQIWALRFTTGVGAVTALLLLAYSADLKVFCPTCLLFYVFVAIAAYIAFINLKPAHRRLAPPALLSAGLLVVMFALLFYPGLNTPREDVTTAKVSTVTEQVAADAPSNPNASELEKFLTSLPFAVQQATSNSLVLYRNAAAQPATPAPKRLSFGTSTAPVHVIEWTDIRCPHCKSLEGALAEIQAISPPNSWSQESRHFPLDSECNPKVQRSGGGVSCLAAKVEICLIGSPDFPRVRTAMFAEQETLTKERIWQIAAQDPQRRTNLEACVNAPQTAATLREDIEYADKYQIDGTPLVVINGRKGTAVPAFILGLIMAKGHDDDPAFLVLPAPSLGPGL